MMNIISVPVCKVQASVNFERGLSMDPFFLRHHRNKDKVVVIMGATGSGKSKLAIDLATHFAPVEIINSDKMQVFQGLEITTNKVTEQECLGVPHHLLGIADPNLDFTAGDFIHHASSAVDSIVDRHCLPIVAGGSNSYIEAFVNHHAGLQNPRLEFCFLWVDVSLPVLHSFLSDRVDRMVEAGLVEEVRQMFSPWADYTKGIRKAIGVPELDQFLRTESTADERTKKKLLEVAISRMKINNCRLASRQLQKIHRLHGLWKRNMHRLDATEVFMMRNNCEESSKEAWENQVLKKSRRIVHKFLYEESNVPAVSSKTLRNVTPSIPPPASLVAMATATH